MKNLRYGNCDGYKILYVECLSYSHFWATEAVSFDVPHPGQELYHVQEEERARCQRKKRLILFSVPALCFFQLHQCAGASVVSPSSRLAVLLMHLLNYIIRSSFFFILYYYSHSLAPTCRRLLCVWHVDSNVNE